jgi:hypothetical protein
MRVQGIELEAEASTLKALEAGLGLVGGDVLPNDK